MMTKTRRQIRRNSQCCRRNFTPGMRERVKESKTQCEAKMGNLMFSHKPSQFSRNSTLCYLCSIYIVTKSTKFKLDSQLNIITLFRTCPSSTIIRSTELAFYDEPNQEFVSMFWKTADKILLSIVTCPINFPTRKVTPRSFSSEFTLKFLGAPFERFPFG